MHTQASSRHARLSSPIWLLLTAALLQPGIAAFASSDWPGFRGPNQTGSVSAEGIFEGEVTGLALDWRTPLGPGYSGIVTQGNRAFTQAAADGADVLVALDLDRGEPLWQVEIGPRTEGHDGSEDGPSATPATDGERVYGVSPRGRAFALDIATGSEIWSRDLVGELATEVPLYDYAASPVLIPGLVVLTTPGSPSGSLVALDRATGETRWTGAPGMLDYQTPVATRLAGIDQLLLWQRERLVGISVDGKELWSVKADGNNDASPVAIEGDRVLLYSGRGSTMLRVHATGDSYEVETLWQTNQLKGGNNSLPVYYDGHIYGYDRAFLSCVDAATGKRMWKSRPPGGSGLIRVEDRLVAYGKNGDLVVIEATPEEYREETRIRATQRESLTWPAFSGGRILVRDATHIAAVSITDQPTPESAITELPPALLPGTEFSRFIETAGQARDASLWVDDFMKQQASFPVLEPQGEATAVHFVYRGPAEDVSLITAGDDGTELPLERLEGTDFFYRSVLFEPLVRTEYTYRFDLERAARDPLNRRSIDGQSELVPPDWQEPEFLAPFRGAQTGSLDTFQLESTHTGDTREITLYRPAGGAEPTALWVVLDGSSWLSSFALPNSLDHVIGKSVAPVAVAFVPPAERSSFLESDGRNTPKLARMVVDELLPQLAERYGLSMTREQRVVMSADWAAMAALYTALTHADVFATGVLLEFGGTFGMEQELEQFQTQPRAEDKPPVRVVSLWNRSGLRMSDRGYHSADKARELAEKLPGLGYEMIARERQDSYGSGAFRAMAVEALRLVSPAR